MKTKKHTIFITSIFTVVNIIIMFILQFRIYNLVGIYGNGNTFFTNLREFGICISSGLFASSFVVLIIAIREYHDESIAALKNLKRIISDINEKLRGICWYNPRIPEDVLIDYFHLKYDEYKTDWEKEKVIFKQNGISFSEDLLKLIEKEEKIKNNFYEKIWENEPESIHRLYKDNTKKKEDYLMSRVPIVENEIESKASQFLESLQEFSNYDIYQIQAAYDSINFLFHKKNKLALNAVILNPISSDIDCIKDELCKYKMENKMQSIYSLILLNKILLKFNDDYSEAYSSTAFYIAFGKYIIDNIINPNEKNKKPKIEDFNIYHHSIQAASFEILYDSLKD